MPGMVKMPDFFTSLVSLPNIILTPALVAGLTLVLMRQMPGMVKMPDFFTSLVATVTRLFNTLEQAFVFNSFSVAIAFNKAPLVIALAPPFFIDFMGGNMMFRKPDGESKSEQLISKS